MLASSHRIAPAQSLLSLLLLSLQLLLLVEVNVANQTGCVEIVVAASLGEVFVILGGEREREREGGGRTK